MPEVPKAVYLSEVSAFTPRTLRKSANSPLERSGVSIQASGSATRYSHVRHIIDRDLDDSDSDQDAVESHAGASPAWKRQIPKSVVAARATSSTRTSYSPEQAREVKKWIRGDDAFEGNSQTQASYSTPNHSAERYCAGHPLSSIGAMIVQDTWGRFNVAAIAPGR